MDKNVVLRRDKAVQSSERVVEQSPEIKGLVALGLYSLFRKEEEETSQGKNSARLLVRKQFTLALHSKKLK
ncbi:TIGR03761 family integrating conjugative element protein [Sesbania bispinosa]|nr:TIGR03761 family integrating conjugative element protein [Sesbania bispinosa]